MGKPDIAVKNWLSDNERFADLFNGMVFGGRLVVRAEELESMDRETDIIVTDKDGKRKGVQRYRDIVKRWKKGVDLAVLTCEALILIRSDSCAREKANQRGAVSIQGN